MAEAVVTLVSVPQAAPLQPEPERDQVTPLFCVPFTVAANTCVPAPAWTVALAGETTTEIAADADITICAEADFVESACETGVSVTVAGLGWVAGAV